MSAIIAFVGIVGIMALVYYKIRMHRESLMAQIETTRLQSLPSASYPPQDLDNGDITSKTFQRLKFNLIIKI